MTVTELIAALRDSLATAYPTRVADLAARPGVVSVAVVPDRAEYETGAMCEPQPVTLTAKVVVQAAAGGETGAMDLLGHIDAIAALVRAAGFAPAEWSAAEVDDQPAIEFTATAEGDG